MKILYIANCKDGTGYAHAACENILALDAAGVTVVPRAIKLNSGDAPYPSRIAELEKQSDKDCDICIQHVLPHMLCYRGEFKKNIAIYYSETSHFKNSGWATRLNLFDEAWVCNHQMIDAARKSGVFIPLHVVPIATDIAKFDKQYDPFELPEDINGTFKFYTIGEVTRRKNLVAALKAFHLEFDPNEPVSFVIKGSAPGHNSIESAKHIDKICLEVKRNLKLRPIEHYASEVVITKRLTEEEIMQLHASCDCYVAPSYGEAWDMPCFDAMGMGKTPIASACTGHLSYMEYGTGWMVDTVTEPVFGMADEYQFADLYVGNETWEAVDVIGLRDCMRAAYEMREERLKKSKLGIDTAKHFSYNRVGAHMLQILQDKQVAAYDVNLADRVSQVHSISFLKERCNEEACCAASSCHAGGCGNCSGG